MAAPLAGWSRWTFRLQMGLLGCALILVVSACQRGSAATPFNNPLLETDGADPWMLYHDGNYYLTAPALPLRRRRQPCPTIPDNKGEAS